MTYNEARKQAIYKYRLNNLDKCRKIQNDYVKNKYDTNEAYKLKKRQDSINYKKWIKNMDTSQSSIYCMRFLF